MKIDHIGIAVRDIEQALQVYQVALGLPVQDVVDVPDQQVRVAFLPLGESNIELVQPSADDSGTARFIEKRGEGIHHICLLVDDIETSVAQLEAEGARMASEIRSHEDGTRYAFVHPKSAHGVLVELYEKPQA